MPKRSLRLVVVLAALAFTRPAAADLTAPLVAPIPVAVVDSMSGEANGVLVAARSAYEKAWAEREAGKATAAVKTADDAIRQIAPLLSGGVDASTRR